MVCTIKIENYPNRVKFAYSLLYLESVWFEWVELQVEV